MRGYFFSFKGRANRAQYWSVSCLLTAIWFAFAVWGKYHVPTTTLTQLLFTVFFLASMIGIVWVGIANHVKRFHDMDRSGWWALLILVPLVGMLVALFWLGFGKGTPADNRFGAAEPDISTKRLLLYALGLLLLAFMAGCVMGVKAGVERAKYQRNTVYIPEGAVVPPATHE